MIEHKFFVIIVFSVSLEQVGMFLQSFFGLLQRRHIMHRLLDLVQSRATCNTTRCEAARTLFASLFHWETSADAVFEQVDGDADGVTPYARIIKLLLRANVSFASCLRAVEFL